MSNEMKPRIRYNADGLQNVVTGLGTDRDKRTGNHFQFESFWDWGQMEAAYQTSWLARQVVEAPVLDATREWRSFNTEKADEVEKEEKRLRVSTHVAEAATWSRLYGGSIILMITDQDLSLPLDVNKVKKGSLKRLVVIDRLYLSGFDYNVTEPMSPNYLMPTWYTIYGGKTRIHYSHVVRFQGERLPMRLRQMNSGWGDSALRKCLEDLKDAISTKRGIATLVQEANVDIINAQGLKDALASGEDEAIINRYRMFGLLKSTQHMGILDESEAYSRNAASFGGLGDVLEIMMQWTAGAAEIPMTRLYGVQSKGIGDSGEGDMKVYNNRIRSYQEGPMRHALEQLDEVLVRSALGEFPEEFDFEYRPLSEPSGAEIAQSELAEAQADQIRIDSGVARQSEIMRLRADSLGISEDRIDAMQKEEEAADDDFDFTGSDPSEEAGQAGQTVEQGGA